MALGDSNTIGESIRRYGRPVLISESLEDRIWECEERFKYYRLLCANLSARLESANTSPDEFDTLYNELFEAECLRDSYSTEALILDLKRSV